ncbi:MAG: response regulator [Burkholderiales bacterium]|jgi:DNA-binding response OmpR family regulator|nr:MAG: response regulator [Burkholderiales bacterium]
MSKPSRKVLIVDDEPNIVTALEFLFKRSGYEVRVAGNGAEALEQVDAFRPDVVLLDVMMPVKSGYEVCQTMRERPDLAQIKVVMLSAKGSEAEINKGMALGADLYVTKPFSTQELVATIDRLFEPGSEPKQ